MNIQGTYTNKGLALTAKTAAGACLRVIRVVGGRFSLRPVKKAIRSSPRRIRLFMCFFVIT